MMLVSLIIALAATAASHPAHHLHPLHKRASYSGVATFNNYAAQGNTNCGPSSGSNGAYGAAASDISPDISGGLCTGSISMSQCAGQVPIGGYQAPACPKSNCGKCYKVTNNGGMGGSSIGGVGKSIMVQIIDACPSTSAYNFCKTDTPANGRCSDPDTNQLDIDQSAYMALTGQAFGSGPSLNIGIEDADCSGATSAGVSTPDSVAPAAPAQSSSDLVAGAPGVHAAGGDKIAEPRIGAQNLAIQDLGMPGSSLSGTATPPPPPRPTTATTTPSITPTSAVPPGPNEDPPQPQGVQEKAPGPDVDDEECDEL